MPSIPDCYEADRQFDAMDLAHTARLMRRPRCVCCGCHILTETCLDLSGFGLSEYACHSCVKNNMIDTDGLEEC